MLRGHSWQCSMTSTYVVPEVKSKPPACQTCTLSNWAIFLASRERATFKLCEISEHMMKLWLLVPKQWYDKSNACFLFWKKKWSIVSGFRFRDGSNWWCDIFAFLETLRKLLAIYVLTIMLRHFKKCMHGFRVIKSVHEVGKVEVAPCSTYVVVVS